MEAPAKKLTPAVIGYATRPSATAGRRVRLSLLSFAAIQSLPKTVPTAFQRRGGKGSVALRRRKHHGKAAGVRLQA